MSQFREDLEAAKPAERLVLQLLQSNNPRYTFVDVSDDCSYYHKGDIKAISKEYPVELFIEVKNDSRIADTKRVLCEEEVLIYETGEQRIGNMYNDCDFYCVVSESERCVYVFNFKKLQEIYKNFGEWKVIKHKEQESLCYLVNLGYCKRKGALIHKLNY